MLTTHHVKRICTQHLHSCVTVCMKLQVVYKFNGYLKKDWEFTGESQMGRIGIRVKVTPFCLCVFITAGAESRNPINSMSLWKKKWNSFLKASLSSRTGQLPSSSRNCLQTFFHPPAPAFPFSSSSSTSSSSSHNSISLIPCFLHPHIIWLLLPLLLLLSTRTFFYPNFSLNLIFCTINTKLRPYRPDLQRILSEDGWSYFGGHSLNQNSGPAGWWEEKLMDEGRDRKKISQ